MGAKGSRQELTGGLVYVDELPRYLDERLQRKYERGMRGVLRYMPHTSHITRPDIIPWTYFCARFLANTARF